jgi:hypothetical protein
MRYEEAKSFGGAPGDLEKAAVEMEVTSPADPEASFGAGLHEHEYGVAHGHAATEPMPVEHAHTSPHAGYAAEAAQAEHDDAYADAYAGHDGAAAAGYASYDAAAYAGHAGAGAYGSHDAYAQAYAAHQQGYAAQGQQGYSLGSTYPASPPQQEYGAHGAPMQDFYATQGVVDYPPGMQPAYGGAAAYGYNAYGAYGGQQFAQ